MDGCSRSEIRNRPSSLSSQRRGSYDQASPRDGGRCHAHVVQGVFPHHLEFRSGLNHECVAVLAQREDLAVISPRGGGKGAGSGFDTLLSVYLLARSSLMAGEEAAVEQSVEVISVNQGRWIVWAGLREIPSHV